MLERDEEREEFLEQNREPSEDALGEDELIELTDRDTPPAGVIDAAVLAHAQAAADSEACDVMLIVGASGVVQPAASLPYSAWNARARIIEVNPEKSELTEIAHVHLSGPAGEVLPRVTALML